MRLIYLLIAYISLALAFLGVLLPGLPATEFVLLSVWAAGKGSPRLQRWILANRLIGPIYHDWNNGKIIRLRYKIASSLSMIICLLLMVNMVHHLPSVLIAAAGMGLGAIYIWSRPGHRPTESWDVQGQATEK